MSINEVRYLPECGSTNAYVKEHFEEFGPVGAVYTTNQTAGRGRLGRTWVNAEGEPMAQSASLDDLTFTTQLPQSGWKKSGSYYYYTLPVPAGSETPVLFSSAVVKDGAAPAGCTMDLQVLAQAVQATPKDAVEAAWGLDPTALKN